jgi:hypothetical protein
VAKCSLTPNMPAAAGGNSSSTERPKRLRR